LKKISKRLHIHLSLLIAFRKNLKNKKCLTELNLFTLVVSYEIQPMRDKRFAELCFNKNLTESLQNICRLIQIETALKKD
jgi:hypothetical protein